MYYEVYKNSIALIYIRSSDDGILNITFDEAVIQPNDVKRENKHIKVSIQWLDEYFKKNIKKNGDVDADLPTFDIKYSATRNALMRIKWGNIEAYGELISPKYAQATGQACSNNPVLLMFPCHRVISKDPKKVFQYMKDFDSDIKRKLLYHERL